MAHVRDCDTSLWLHNKLGTSNDLWISSSICSQLNKDVLVNIKECFIGLQPQVKLKLLLSFLHLPRRNVDEWKTELDEILELALVDGDQWVSMMAELLKSYPGSGVIFLNIEENSAIFTEVLADLKKQVRKHTNLSMMPMECLYLNKNALNAVVGQQPAPVKHFALKRKPKSATLRAELIQKASDSTTNAKKSTTMPSLTSKSRVVFGKDQDRKPLKGIPSRSIPNIGFGSPNSVPRLGSAAVNGSSLNRSNSLLRSTPAGKKDGGIKLLDINEQPIGYGRDAKRRRKLPETETPVSKEKESAPPAAATATPEYAAGLLQGSKPLTAPATPLVPHAPSASSTSHGPTYIPTTQSSDDSSATLTKVVATKSSILATPSVGAATENATESRQLPTAIPVTQYTIPGSISNRINVAYHLGTTDKPIQAEAVATRTITHPNAEPLVTPQQQAPPMVITTPVVVPQPIQPVAQPPQPPQQQKKGLSLTKEQMLEAQEMFKSSNKVTRPEKALILGFMAGSRDNPCPNLGNVINITLSENQEDVQQFDGSFQNVTVETLFQMNYGTGEWKTIKRYNRSLHSEVE